RVGPVPDDDVDQRPADLPGPLDPARGRGRQPTLTGRDPMSRVRIPTALGLTAALTLLGCGRTPPPIVPAEGAVRLNGHPLPHAEVRCGPTFEGLGAEYIATAVTDEQGHFKLACPLRDGAAACENRVTVADGPVPEGARGMSAAAQTKASAFLAGL